MFPTIPNEKCKEGKERRKCRHFLRTSPQNSIAEHRNVNELQNIKVRLIGAKCKNGNGITMHSKFDTLRRTTPIKVIQCGETLRCTHWCGYLHTPNAWLLLLDQRWHWNYRLWSAFQLWTKLITFQIETLNVFFFHFVRFVSLSKNSLKVHSEVWNCVFHDRYIFCWAYLYTLICI